MLTFEQMFIRLLIALALGGILGVERELVGKEAGVRTQMLVSGGAAIFTMIGLSLPGILAAQSPGVPLDGSGFLQIIANVVVGIGFLGGGLIIKTNDQTHHAHGVTTAALVWATAGVGILAGAGLSEFALASTLTMAFLLYILRKAGIAEKLEPHGPPHQ